MAERHLDADALELRRKLRSEKWRRARKMKLLYVSLLPAVILTFIFRYVPMYGILIAFKRFSPALGIWQSPWNNFYHFEVVFESFYFWRILRNTLIISFYRIIFGFPAPIILALLINEFSDSWFKKTFQTISYLPHFISWVVLAGILVEVLSPQRGIVAYIYAQFGEPAPLFLTDKRLFRPLLIVTGIWQGIGWGSIIYLAAISGIDPSLYEVAQIDGAGRFRMAIHITVPSLVPVMTILFILRLGRILNAGFDQIFNLYNPLVYEVADIIDTYVYRAGILNRRYGFTTAVGLFKNVVGITLIMFTNFIIKRYSEYGIW